MTPAQRNLLRVIERHQANHDGASPSFEEMREAMAMASKSGIERLVISLEECGAIQREPNRARRIRVVCASGPLSMASDAQILAEAQRRGLLAPAVAA